MNEQNQQWMSEVIAAASEAGHVWPHMAAAEAALESAHAGVFGASVLARDARNLFGTKQHKHPEYGTLSLPTKEFLDGAWVTVGAAWVDYPTLADCFRDRMDTLTRLASIYPHYRAALAATDAITFVTEVSRTWSTDPNRAEKVIAIYNEYEASLTQQAPAAETPPATPPRPDAPGDNTPAETSTLPTENHTPSAT